jgi:ribosomal protein S18 acetylase RimI-like enzyme
MVNLRKMNIHEFETFEKQSTEGYIQDKIQANGYTLAEATAIAKKDNEKFLPNGFYSTNNFLFIIEDESGKSLGYLWYVINGAEGNQKAFIADIMIYEEFQGLGYGKSAMLELEKHVKSQGIQSIGLHVFGFNTKATKLYTKLDYQITDLVMEKKL